MLATLNHRPTRIGEEAEERREARREIRRKVGREAACFVAAKAATHKDGERVEGAAELQRFRPTFGCGFAGVSVESDGWGLSGFCAGLGSRPRPGCQISGANCESC